SCTSLGASFRALPMTFHDFREGWTLGGPAEPSGVNGTHAAVGSHAVSGGLAMLADRVRHAQAPRSAPKPEGAADRLGDLLERGVAVLREEEGGGGGLLDSQHVEIDQVVDVDVRVAVEPFPEVDARADLFGECGQLRDLVAVRLQAPPGSVDHG